MVILLDIDRLVSEGLLGALPSCTDDATWLTATLRSLKNYVQPPKSGADRCYT